MSIPEPYQPPSGPPPDDTDDRQHPLRNALSGIGEHMAVAWNSLAGDRRSDEPVLPEPPHQSTVPPVFPGSQPPVDGDLNRALNQLAAAQRNLEIVQRDLDGESTRRRQLESELKGEREARAYADDARDAAVSAGTALRTRLHAAETELAVLRETGASLEALLARERESVQRAAEEEARLVATIGELESRLAGTVTDLESRLAITTADRDALRNEAEHLSGELEAARAAIEALRTHVREVEAAHAGTEERRSALQDEVEYLRHEVYSATGGGRRGLFKRGAKRPASMARPPAAPAESAPSGVSEEQVQQALERRLFGGG